MANIPGGRATIAQFWRHAGVSSSGQTHLNSCNSLEVKESLARLDCSEGGRSIVFDYFSLTWKPIKPFLKDARVSLKATMRPEHLSIAAKNSFLLGVAAEFRCVCLDSPGRRGWLSYGFGSISNPITNWLKPGRPLPGRRIGHSAVAVGGMDSFR
jgi:hypothetical protein